MQNFNLKKKKEGGYTIIETMIAVAIFLLVVTVGIGSLLSINLVHLKSQDMRSILDSLSFAMEDISRSLRTGVTYDGGGNMISFYNSDSKQVIYAISGGVLEKTIDGQKYDLTPDEIILDADSGFILTGQNSSDPYQPYVKIKLSGSINYKGNITPFVLETGVSQRQADLP